jgi:hypothetical protein
VGSSWLKAVLPETRIDDGMARGENAIWATRVMLPFAVHLVVLFVALSRHLSTSVSGERRQGGAGTRCFPPCLEIFSHPPHEGLAKEFIPPRLRQSKALILDDYDLLMDVLGRMTIRRMIANPH